MVQIIERNPTGVEKFLQAISNGVAGAAVGGEHIKNAMADKELTKSLSERFGDEFKNIKDPNLIKALMVEQFKQKGKESLFGQKLNQLSSIFNKGGPEGQKQELEEQSQQQGLGEGAQSGIDVSRLSPEQLAYANIVNPNLGRSLQHSQDLASREKKEERKPIEKSVENFFTKLSEDAEKLPQLELSVDSMLDSVLSGEIDSFSSAHLGEIATAFGVPSEISRILETPGSKQFKSARKQFLSSTLKEAFRGATTGREIDLAESLLAELGTKPEANMAAIFLIQSDLEIRKERQRLAAEAEEKGISNYKIPKYVNKNLEKFRKDVHDEYIDSVKELRRRAGLK